ncbi:MAG: hypothetical protein NTW55_02150 [Planctomycetota bacterium]|nr:hypothetical protein [Planctomycetota bacterium]
MKTKKVLFYLLAAVLTGCVPVMSLNPLSSEKDAVFEDKLLGTWVGNDSNTTWEFKGPDVTEKAYVLLFSQREDKKEAKGLFFARLVKIENRFFLDVYPNQWPSGVLEDPNKTVWFYNSFFFVPVHTFIKIDSFEPELKFRLTDDDKMKELFDKDPNAVKHEFYKDNKFVLTASTKELQAFVLKYADDNRVFSNEIKLVRKKAEEPNSIDPNHTSKETQ